MPAWSEDELDTLRVLWEAGCPTAEIGRRMHRPKNSIIGKAHRLDLEARPDPIIRRAPEVTLPALPSRPVYRMSAPPLPRPPPQKQKPLPPCLVPKIQTFKPRGNTGTCCWPIGEPGTPTFRFCEEAAVIGYPYCGDHCDIAYVRIRRREGV